MTVADEADQPIAQVLPFQEHEQDEDDHEAGGAGRRDERAEPAEAAGRVVRHDHRLRRRPPGLGRDPHVLLDRLERGLKSLDRPAAARAANVADLFADVGAIGDQIGAEAAHLAGDGPGGQAQRGKHQRDNEQHRRRAADAPLQPYHGRGQHEGQENGETDGHEDGLRPIEDGDHQHTTGERRPAAQRTERVSHRPGT